MTRVSEASSIYAIKHAVGKTKSRLEDLQIKGSNLKRVQKPSDDPVANMEILSIRSRGIDGDQYKRNASVAKAQLTFTENAIEELTELLVKAKELAIGQSSNVFDPQVRRSVAQEVSQLHDQAVSIANRRLGNKYIFSGHKTLSKPFDANGDYKGDSNQTNVEVAKDVFVPISFNGKDIFFEKESTAFKEAEPLKGSPIEKIESIDGQIKLKEVEQLTGEDEMQINRTPATIDPISGEVVESSKGAARTTIFNNLSTLKNALLTNNHEIIQDLLPQIDSGIDRLIEVRTKIGSVLNSISNSVVSVERNELTDQEHKSQIEDADVAELFTDLTRQQNVLNATYKASAQMMNRNLMDYIN